MHKIAFTARHATSRIPPNPSIGLCLRAGEDRITLEHEWTSGICCLLTSDEDDHKHATIFICKTQIQCHCDGHACHMPSQSLCSGQCIDSCEWPACLPPDKWQQCLH